MSKTPQQGHRQQAFVVLLRTQPDSRLTELIRAGDERAFEELDRRYRRKLLRLSCAIGADPSSAEDLVQEAMLRAKRAIEGGTVPGITSRWLRSIVRNATLNWLRDSPDAVELLEGAPAPDDTTAGAEQRERLQALIAEIGALPPRQRVAIINRELHGMSHAEIGAKMGISPGAVRQLIYRARDTLRARDLGLIVPAPLLAWLASNSAKAAGAGVSPSGAGTGAATTSSGAGASGSSAGAGAAFGAAPGGLGLGLKVAGASVLGAGALALGVPQSELGAPQGPAVPPATIAIGTNFDAIPAEGNRKPRPKAKASDKKEPVLVAVAPPAASSPAPAAPASPPQPPKKDSGKAPKDKPEPPAPPKKTPPPPKPEPAPVIAPAPQPPSSSSSCGGRPNAHGRKEPGVDEEEVADEEELGGGDTSCGTGGTRASDTNTGTSKNTKTGTSKSTK